MFHEWTVIQAFPFVCRLKSIYCVFITSSNKQLRPLMTMMIGNLSKTLIRLVSQSSQILSRTSRPFSQLCAIRTTICSTRAAAAAEINCQQFLIQTREYKQKARLRKRCVDCYFKWLNGRLYVECKTNPRHKQHHMKSLEKGYDHLAHGYHDSTAARRK
jgi:ribosomal protein L36